MDLMLTDITASRLDSGGLTLSDHANMASTPDHQWNLTLNDGRLWDAVVLQDQSQIPGFPTTHTSWQRSLDGARVLDGMIQDLDADTVFLMTWGRRDGDSTNPSLYPNFTAMQVRLEAGYRMYAENLSTVDRPVFIAPVGMAFKWVHDYVASQGGDPTAQGTTFYDLYSSDGSHPSPSGSYLASCVLYATLTGNSPEGLHDGVSLDPTLKALLQRAAAETVFENTTDYEYPWRPTWESHLDGNDLEVKGRGLVIGCNAYYNFIKNNSFSHGIFEGVRILDANSRSNFIHGNGFRENNMGNPQARDDGNSTRWDVFSQGNYWSDYEARYPDATHDGVVWDTPYEIPGGGLDRYPLVRFPAFEDHDPPQAFAGEDQVVPEGTLVQLDGGGSYDEVGIVGYTWTLMYDGKVVVLDGAQVEFHFDIPGVYNVTLNVTDAASNWAVDLVVITVVDTTEPVARITPVDSPFEQHTNVLLIGSGSSDNVGIVNWTWEIIGEQWTVELHGEVVEFVFADEGEYMVLLTAIDAAGNRGTDMQYLIVLDTEAPVADAGKDDSIDQGYFLTLDGSLSEDNVGITSYTWTFEEMGTAIILTGMTPKHQFLYAGLYTITLLVEDDTGNSDTDTVSITVEDTEPPVADAGGDRTVEQGDTVFFDLSASTDNVMVVEGYWTFTYKGRSLSIEAAHFNLTYDVPGVYTVSLQVTDGNRLSGVDTITVTVLDTVPPVAAPIEDMTVNEGTEVTLDGSASMDAGGVVAWTWSFDYGGSAEELEGEVASFTFSIPGDYMMTLRVTDSASHFDEHSFIIHVRDTHPPVPPPFRDREVVIGDRVNLVAKGAQDNVGIVSWVWTIKGGGKTVVLEGEEVDHVFEDEGMYLVRLTLEDAEGNTAETQFIVTVGGSSLPYLVLGAITVVVMVLLVVYFRRPSREAGS
jgi:PKD repeat protein